MDNLVKNTANLLQNVSVRLQDSFRELITQHYHCDDCKVSQYYKKSFCRCEGCRYPEYHLTKYHQCGTCNKFGHGTRECHNSQKQINLYNKVGDPTSMPYHLRCTIEDCESKESHSTSSHSPYYDKQYHSTLSDEQLEWLSSVLNSDSKCVVIKKSFITDYYYDAVKQLDDARRKCESDKSLFIGVNAGHGYSIYALTTGKTEPIRVNMIDGQDFAEIRHYTCGYMDASVLVN